MSNSIAGEAVVPGLAASPTNRINNFGYYLSVKKNKICTSTSGMLPGYEQFNYHIIVLTLL